MLTCFEVICIKKNSVSPHSLVRAKVGQAAAPNLSQMQTDRFHRQQSRLYQQRLGDTLLAPERQISDRKDGLERIADK